MNIQSTTRKLSNTHSPVYLTSSWKIGLMKSLLPGLVIIPDSIISRAHGP